MKAHSVIIIGAGPGGLAVAAALKERQIECVIFERGEVGQAWLDYPSDTHLLSESTERPGHHDENMIAGVPTSEVFLNIPHPNHIMYQKYLKHVVQEKKLVIETGIDVKSVMFNPELKKFLIATQTVEGHQEEVYMADFVVWAAGMYSTPNDGLDSEGAYIHYAHMPYLEQIDDQEITVVGSANGASTVILELAKPGRLVHLIVAHEYTIPLPIDCLWKEQMAFIKQLQNQGLVKITENFRVKRIYERQDSHEFAVVSEDGKEMDVPTRPIVCTGFLPNVSAVKELVDILPEEHDPLLALDENHQSKKQPGLYVAGVMGKLDPEEGFIRFFRDFGKLIAKDIAKKIQN